MLNSYHPGFIWSDNETAGFLEAIKEAFPELDVPVEYLDGKRFFSTEDRIRNKDFLKSKYGNRGFNLVVAFDNPALELLVEYQDELFPGTPVVFGGIGDYRQWSSARPHMTGVAEIQDVTNTIDLALRLHPGIRRMLILDDDTVTGRAARRDIERVFDLFRGRAVFFFLPPCTFAEAQDYIAGLPDDAAVLIHSYSTDRTGKTLPLDQSTRVFTARASVPVYAAHETRLGHGIVGGYLLSGREHGHHTARIAARVIAGEAPERIPVDETGTSRPMLDYHQLVRFGVSMLALPRDVIVINAPDDPFMRYAPIIAAVAAVLITLTVLVIYLAIAILRRRAAEAEREKMRQRLVQAQKMEALGRLAGGIAHDVNNTLGVIYGYADLALSTLEDGTPLRRNVEEIMKAANRSSELTKQLLSFARGQGMEPRVLKLDEVTMSNETMLRRLAGEGIEIIFSYDQDLRPVRIDASHYERILANLVTNARDAMPGGGVINISLQNVVDGERATVGRRAASTDGHVRLTVKDNGVGMDDYTREHIFDPFFTTKTIGRGTGLGMSIVYAAVMNNGGRIEVASAPGKGSVFQIFFPCFVGEAETRSETETETPRRGGEKILVVEDEPQILSVARTALARYGYTVLTASHPAEALSLFASQRVRIDLLITDIIMPEMDGWELTRRVRECRPGLPVLYMSGYAANSAEQGGIDMRASFIQKPFRMNTLLNRVRELLDRTARDEENKAKTCAGAVQDSEQLQKRRSENGGRGKR